MRVYCLICAFLCRVSSGLGVDNSSFDNPSNRVPDEALTGVYSECIIGLSFACLQRKLIAFLFELDRVKSINLVGDAVMAIRKDVPVDTAESARIAQYVDETHLKEVIDHLVDRFFENHFLRVKLPRSLEDLAAEAGDDLYLDIDFKSDPQLSDREGEFAEKL